MHNQENKLKKQIIEILFLVVLIGVTFYCYMRGYSFDNLWTVLKNANVFYLTAGVSMMLLFICCEAVNIHLIMKTLGQNIPLHRCIQYSGIGFYFSSITPSASGGQPAQIYYMRKDKISVPMSSLTIFYIVFVYQISMILIGIVMSCMRFSIFLYFLHRIPYLFVFGFVVNTTVIFLLSLLMFSNNWPPRIIHFITILLSKLHFNNRTNKFEDKMEKGISSYREKVMILKQYPVLFFKVLFVTMIQMLSLTLIPALVYRCMGYNTFHIIDLITCQSLLTISVSAIPLPGAEGISQGGFLQIYDMFFQKNAIISAMLIHRVLSFYLPLILCFLLTMATHIRIAKQDSRGDNCERK